MKVHEKQTIEKAARKSKRPIADDPLMSSSAVRAEFGNPSAMTLYRWVQRGILPEPRRIAGRNYFLRSDVLRVKQGKSGCAQSGHPL